MGAEYQIVVITDLKVCSSISIPEEYGTISSLSMSKQIIFIGTSNGTLARADISGPEAVFLEPINLSSGKLIQIFPADDSIWLLFAPSTLGFIEHFDQFLGLAEVETLGAIRKYKLDGLVRQVCPLPQGVGDKMGLSWNKRYSRGILAVGNSPMVQLSKDLKSYEDDIIADEFDALKIKTIQAANLMSSAVGSFARNLFHSSRNASKESLTLNPTTSEEAISPTSPKSLKLCKSKRSINVGSEWSMDDGGRMFENLQLSNCSRYALLTDTFHGRILLLDIFSGCFTRLWKGYRDGRAFFVGDQLQAVFVQPKQTVVELWDTLENRRIERLDLTSFIENNSGMKIKELVLLTNDLVLASVAPEDSNLVKTVFVRIKFF